MYGKENIIILFHAEWCGACQRFKPTWEKFTENFPKDKNSKKVKVYKSRIHNYLLLKEIR